MAGEALGGCLGASLPRSTPDACSMNSNMAVYLEISNTCAFDVDVLWIDYDCGEELVEAPQTRTGVNARQELDFCIIRPSATAVESRMPHG